MKIKTEKDLYPYTLFSFHQKTREMIIDENILKKRTCDIMKYIKQFTLTQ